MTRNTSFARTLSGFVERLGVVSVVSEPFPIHPYPIHGVVERGDNLSRHNPIWVKLKLGQLPLRNPARTWATRKPCLSKASHDDVDNYTASLQDKLLALQVPDSAWCADPHCRNDHHCQERDKLVLGILDCVVKASHAYGGRWTGGKKKGQGKPVPRSAEDV